MPTYEFRCRTCGDKRDTDSRVPPVCLCGDVMRRVYSFSIGNSFTPHYNHSVGAYVSSAREFNDLLKEGSERNTAATGIEHNYQPLTPAEMMDKMDPSGEGLEETRKLRRDTGVDPPSTRKVIT